MSMVSSQQGLSDLCDQVVDWYWAYGQNRAGKYEVPQSWLDELYRVRGVSRAAEKARRSAKPSIAVWGPSQAGKSTLISHFIDEQEGANSALAWPGGEKARFNRSILAEDAVALNPHNAGSDASGCVSRFVLRDDAQIIDPRYPVELKLATGGEIMHALAAGYLSECLAADAEGRMVFLDADAVLKKLDKLGAPAGTPDRVAFDELHQLSDIVSMLAAADFSRYRNLNVNQKWERSLRAVLLGHPSLRTSVAAVRDFAFDLLWDNHRVLTDLWSELVRHADWLRGQWGHERVFCSMEVAAVLLDIDSYKTLLRYHGQPAGASAAEKKISDIAAQLSWERRPEGVFVGRGFGNPLVHNEREFGLLQGLVWELTIPLRKEILKKSSPDFGQFLEKTDLLDFPGVALQYDNVETQLINMEKVDPIDARLLTVVLKRGKTASIVTSYARSFGIDAFVLLVRAQHFPAQPQQLLSGILTWWKACAPEYDPRQVPRVRPEFPLNLGLTFCGQLVSSVGTGGVGTGLEPVFHMLGRLDVLADPGLVTTFALTYPQFPNGQISLQPEAKRRAIEAIEADRSFKRQFNTEISLQSFHAMATEADGGVAYFFRQLLGQVDDQRRGGMLAATTARAIQTLSRLTGDLAPLEGDDSDKQKEVIQRFAEAIVAGFTAPPTGVSEYDAAARISYSLRSLFHVDPEILEPIPQHAAANRQGVVAYIERQFSRWISTRNTENWLAELPADPPLDQSRILHLLIEASPTAALANWLIAEFGEIQSQNEARICRRYLALAMANALLFSDASRPSHAPMSDSANGLLRRLATYAKAETGGGSGAYGESPHFASFINPFLGRLNAALGSIVGQRPSQPGDSQIFSLYTAISGQSSH